MPRVLFDVAEINEVKEGTECGIDEVVELPAFLVCESLGLDKLRRAFEILLKEHRRLDPARVSLKDRRSIFQVRHDEVGNLEIEADQIKLGEFLVRPVDAIETRYGHKFAPDLDDEIAFRLCETQKL